MMGEYQSLEKLSCLNPWEREWIENERRKEVPREQPMIEDYPIFDDPREDQLDDKKEERGVVIIELLQYKSL
ncbi:hypothetical protein D6777_01495 [Candidatus Woesearchaeota archaeon]|nr:MAG: hypothetical protein D6777_01495 [Candidatus Woesearchaeota archaeon]